MANAFAAAVPYSSYGQFVSIFVEMLVSAGWKYMASGDGLSGYSATGKIFSGTGSGALGWGNPGAWARVQDPDVVGIREITIQHNNAGGAIIKYSPLAKFTAGGSATLTPTAPDQKILRNSYTPVWLAGPATGVAYGCAKDTAPYGFWYACTNSGAVSFAVGNPGVVTYTANGLTAPQGTTSATVRFVTGSTLPTSPTLPGGAVAPDVSYFAAAAGVSSFQLSTTIQGTGVQFTSTGSGTVSILRLGIMMDPVTSVPEDPDPVVWLIGRDSAWLTNRNCLARPTDGTNLSNSTSVVYGGTVEGAFATMSADRSLFLSVQPSGYACNSTGSSTPLFVMSNTGIPVNPFNANKYEALPFFWARVQYTYQGAFETSQLGIKGWSSMARWTGIQRTSCLDTLDAKKWIAVGCMWLPWDGSTTPVG